MPNKFQNQTEFGGINLSATPDNIGDIEASDCDSMDFSIDGIMSVSSGKTSIDTEVAGLTGPTSDYPMYVFKKSFGTQREILVRVARISSNIKLQWYTGSRFELISLTNFNSSKFGFATGNGDAGKNVNRLFIGNGVNDMMFWNGATTRLVSVTSNSITGYSDLATEGFLVDPYGVANTILINGQSFTYTGIAGSTFTGVTPDPTASFNSTIFANDGITNIADERLMDSCLVQSYKIQYNAVGLSGNNITRTDTSIDFSTAGFQLGQRVFVTGFTDVDTNKVYTIKTVTNTTITFADGEVGGATEAAGNYITVSAGAPKGNILAVDNGKLYIAGVPGQENTLNYSVTNDLTNFAITTDAKLTDGGYYPFFLGGKQITALYPRGNNRIIVHKNDGIFSYNLEVNSNNIVIPTVDVLAMGNGVGAVNNSSITSYDKLIFYFNGANEIKSMEQSVYNTSTFNFETIVPQLRNVKISGTPYLIYDYKKARLILSCGIDRTTSYSANALNYLISVYIKSTPNGKTYKLSFDNIPLANGATNYYTVTPIVFTSSNFSSVIGAVDETKANKLLVYPVLTTNVYVWGGDKCAATNSKPYWISGQRMFGEPAMDKEFSILNYDGFLYGDTQLRATVMYGFNGRDGIKTYVIDKNSDGIDGITVGSYNYKMLGYNSLFNNYNFGLLAGSYYFKIPLHVDVNKSDRYSIKFEINNATLTDTWFAINNLSTNPTLKDVNHNNIINQNVEDGYGIGSMIVGSTNKVA